MGFQRLRRLSWLIILSLLPCTLMAGQLTAIRLSSAPASTRIVLDLNQAVSHSLFQLSDPTRIVVDLPNTSASSALSLPVPKGLVRSVRTGPRPGGELRVVFDLTERADPSSFLLPPDGASGHRLVIDLGGPTNAGRASSAAVSSSSASLASVSSAPVTRRITQEYTGRDLVVVIDAGHGGHDPGTTGRGGVREKDVVLQISKRLAALVDAAPGLKAVLIRDSDRYVPLQDRLRLAHEAQAELFISIHADWNDDRRLEGATVYSIKTRRAETETAKRLANRENAGALIESGNLANQADVVARLLLEVSQRWSIDMSEAAGARVIDRIGQVTTLRKSTVEQGNLVVLTSPDIPSLLIETGFLSNPKEEARLRDANFQQSYAQALYAGIVDYFRTNHPADSYIARNPLPEPRGTIQHVIARGETLSEIAGRYRVSLRELRLTNQLNGDVIRIGQVLTIPAIH